ncbi:restriction endonuclease subunit S [Halovibrio sp. HP20-50]|uniref:restriction endonuclease subunit S n=1 Tax=Halovibrio sp. HP20-59 TaxID=3080275 RepID=UPI00294ABBB3|nr:restriction endonuclease subunit S [Halovibrio sp. HP20-59]MEA2119752.1 restriction endonuclease subunit S [Halovibrio sp. HP20-59]
MSSNPFPDHWQIMPLTEAVDALIDYRGKTPKKTDGGIPLVTAKIVKGGTLLPAAEYIAEDDYESWMVRGLPEAGDIVVTTEAPLGEVAQLTDANVALAQRIVTLRGARGLLLNDYLRYVMQGSYVQGQLESRSSGSTVKGIKQSELRKVLLPIPPLQEQGVIASVLKSVDDKIQLNHRINHTLEQMAQALFKSWFVDFEPVKAKVAALEAGGSDEDALLAAMEAVSGKTADQLDALSDEQPEHYAELRDTAELFPSAKQDSELGEIPEGWEVSQIGDEVTVVGGGTPSTKKPEFWEGGHIHWTTPKDLSNLPNKVLIDTERKITSVGLAKISSGLLPVGTVLMSSRAPVGYLALAKTPLAVNQGYIAMKCEHRLSPEFVIQWCAAFMPEIKGMASGTTFAEISKKNFKVIPLLVPSADVVKAYSQHVVPFYSAIESNVRGSRALSELRDTLLPKLLSGELTLPDVNETQAEPRGVAHV